MWPEIHTEFVQLCETQNNKMNKNINKNTFSFDGAYTSFLDTFSKGFLTF